MGNRRVFSAVHVVLINLTFRKLKLRQPEPYATQPQRFLSLLLSLSNAYKLKSANEDMESNKSLTDFALSALSSIRADLLDEAHETLFGKQKLGYQAQNMRSRNNPMHRHSSLLAKATGSCSGCKRSSSARGIQAGAISYIGHSSQENEE